MDSHGIQRLPLRKEGWNFWDWEGRKIHYITAGQYHGSARLERVLCVCLFMPHLNYHAAVLSLGMAPFVISLKVNPEHAFPMLCR